MPLLTQNSELKPHRIHNFSIPAWYVRLDGKVFKTCPNAGTCAQVCYARNGTYMFSNVLAAHTKNLRLTLEQPQKFIELINAELKTKKFKPTKQPRLSCLKEH
jgi:Na+-translocating ferredoxin:NAD+ oxidoreductase RnfC subunit